MTYFHEAQLRAERRKRLKEQGLCTACGKNPVGTNQDGSVSVRCDECKQPNVTMTGRVTMQQLKDKVKPVTPEWGGEIGFYDYRDGTDFKAFRDAVKRLIAQYGPLTSREIKSRLGEHNATWLAESLHALLGDIEEVGITIVRYQIAGAVRRVETVSYNNRREPSQPSKRDYPVGHLEDPKRRITA